MNNYNSLGAVVAGINGTAINRLAQTHELVRPEIRKKFMRLELLMGTHKGHTKYRLAWENTSSERIPFIPVLRRDLASADEGNRTFLEDGTINWNKFQVMGDILENVARAQEKPYTNLSANPIVRKMMEETAATANEDVSFSNGLTFEEVALIVSIGSLRTERISGELIICTSRPVETELVRSTAIDRHHPGWPLFFIYPFSFSEFDSAVLMNHTFSYLFPFSIQKLYSLAIPFFIFFPGLIGVVYLVFIIWWIDGFFYP